ARVSRLSPEHRPGAGPSRPTERPRRGGEVPPAPGHDHRGGRVDSRTPRAERMSRMAPPRVIFFDAADTLFRVKGSVGEVYCSLARKYGVTADRDTIQQAFVKACEAAPPPVF